MSDLNNPNESTLSNLKNTATSAADAAGDAIQNTAEKAVDGAQSAAQSAKDTFKSVASEAKEGMGNFADDVKDAVDDLTDAPETTAVAMTEEGKNLSLLIWIGTIFFGFVPGLIMYLVKQDDAYVMAQAKENLNFNITYAIAFIACSILSVVIIGVFLLPIVAIAFLVFSIIGAVKASKGEVYQVPFILRLLK